MGINLGALIGPLVAGYLAQRVDWHIGFASRRCRAWRSAWCSSCSASGTCRRRIDRIAAQPALAGSPAGDETPAPAGTHRSGSPRPNGSRSCAIVVFFLFAILFWAGYEQAGSTLNLFADRYTRLEVFGYSFPSSWFQSVQPFFVITLAPLFAWTWVKLGAREPSVSGKFALGLFFMGLAFLVLIPAGAHGPGGRGHPRQPVVARGVVCDFRVRRAVPQSRGHERRDAGSRRRASSG